MLYPIRRKKKGVSQFATKTQRTQSNFFFSISKRWIQWNGAKSSRFTYKETCQEENSTGFERAIKTPEHNHKQNLYFYFFGRLFAMYYELQKDEALIELLSRSDTKAFDEIYRRYWAVVFRYAVCKVHTREIAEDLCQDVFVSLWQRRNAVSIQNLEAYLVQATKFGVLNHIRVKIKDQKIYHLDAAYQNTDNETENNIFLRNLMEAWEKAVSLLPSKTQEVFRLSKVYNYTNKEIASRLDLTEKAVEYHVTKSFKILRLQLKDFLVLLLLVFLR